MSLSDFLTHYINKKKTNITQFAQYLGIDRSTLHKIIKGQRPATNEALVKRMARYLCLSQEETKQLLDAYEIDTIGAFIFYRRKHIQTFFKEADHVLDHHYHITEQVQNDQVLIDDVYKGKINVEHILYTLYSYELREEDPHVRIMEQPYEMSIIFDSFNHLSSNMPMTHLFCLDNSQKQTKNNEFYNLKCLNNLLPVILRNKNYHPYYYYSNVSIMNEHDVFYPNVMITTRYVFTYTNDHNQGILYKLPQIVNAYKEKFDAYLKETECFMTRDSWTNYLADTQTFFDTHVITQEIMTTPCPTYVFEESDLSIMRKALKDFFPNKEEFIKDFQKFRYYWNEVFYPQHSDIFHIIYTLQGLRYTAKTGYLHDIPPELFNPLSLKDRLLLITKWKEFCKKNTHVMMADMPYLSETSTTYFQLSDQSFYIIASDSTGTLANISIKEITLVEAFKDFIDNVVIKNAYSKDDEMKLIDECIEMIKKEM
ncbi:helix-turn-helix transcriptional regulator [uncultured Catenibacterium sp.]|uniref:helix-turn-helix domain-containing protein n=1 Tax=uncultured Catenibacterium sp. TaxID=286142 RepID=UPI00260C7C6E|nr:helix-turn-helix transcriptional regulator [uncultured Catenibacterium sp.]